MANTYTQIYVHIVFAVSGRQNLIPKTKREEIQKYITGIIQNRKQKLISIFCMPDHVHLLISMDPNISISNLVKDIKSNSSKFINENGFVVGKFNWQEGFGAFSYSKSQMPAVNKYILEQEKNHKSKSFKEEYISILQNFGIEYEDKYLFEWVGSPE